ncbi:hypothetical protein INT47_012325 [Mucor saturninus]|uniref:Uncharacterized protein n=1 Tax=Mucor saturninus TaxID=64648 RepID=A0A8H7QXE7_9FUNG|nr:hypothetical protein INT47_012325 [Mucor saturninus]
MLKLKNISYQNAVQQNVSALHEVHKQYNTRSRQTEAKDDEVYEIDGLILTDMEKSAGSVIKSEAIKKAKAVKTFANLDQEEKNTVFLGLNSICDLSNNDNSKHSQKALFNKKAWKELKNIVYVSRDMKKIPDHVEKDLIKIEKEQQIAIDDIKKAYQICLELQTKYAFSKEEAYFNIYSHIIRLLNKNHSILKNETAKPATEQDYVGQVWRPIFSAIFDDKD